jgi:tRNA 2-selenouridine synthase
MKDPAIAPIEEVVARLGEFNAVVDARSPAEYAEDRLPGAINAPVLDDAQRALVGTTHAQISAFDARRLGAAIAARNIGDLIDRLFAQRDRDFRPLVYCWRGGQRSGSLATVMARIGWRTTLIEGGYRAFRRHVIAELDTLPKPLRLIVVGGRTGSAKSRLLERIALKGGQVLDLEKLASHRGSLLGSLPSEAQPGQKRFETMLWETLRGLSPGQPVFVESESRKIGQCQIPGALIEAIRSSQVAIVEAPIEVRSHFLLDEYQHFLKDVPRLFTLLDCMIPLHGAQRIGEWKRLVDTDHWPELVERLLLEHYDPSYDRSMKRNFGRLDEAPRVRLEGTDDATLERGALALARLGTEG